MLTRKRLAALVCLKTKGAMEVKTRPRRPKVGHESLRTIRMQPVSTVERGPSLAQVVLPPGRAHDMRVRGRLGLGWVQRAARVTPASPSRFPPERVLRRCVGAGGRSQKWTIPPRHSVELTLPRGPASVSLGQSTSPDEELLSARACNCLRFILPVAVRGNCARNSQRVGIL